MFGIPGWVLLVLLALGAYYIFFRRKAASG